MGTTFLTSRVCWMLEIVMSHFTSVLCLEPLSLLSNIALNITPCHGKFWTTDMALKQQHEWMKWNDHEWQDCSCSHTVISGWMYMYGFFPTIFILGLFGWGEVVMSLVHLTWVKEINFSHGQNKLCCCHVVGLAHGNLKIKIYLYSNWPCIGILQLLKFPWYDEMTEKDKGYGMALKYDFTYTSTSVFHRIKCQSTFPVRPRVPTHSVYFLNQTGTKKLDACFI